MTGDTKYRAHDPWVIVFCGYLIIYAVDVNVPIDDEKQSIVYQ